MSSENKKVNKFRKLCAKYFKAKSATIDSAAINSADINIADIDSANINNADINTLDVQTINVRGKDVTCLINAPPVTQNADGIYVWLSPTGPTGPGPVPENINPVVYDALVENAINYTSDLQERVALGRNLINDFLIEKGCPLSCPPPSPDPVPLEIYGTLTLPIYRTLICGPTGATGTVNARLTTAVNFNLQVDYRLEVANSIDSRLLSVLIQVGYLDTSSSTPNVVIDEIFVANKQFYPTLDTLYGENFANTISIPSAVINKAYNRSKNPNLQGAVQMVIYKEEGLCIWTPNSDGSAECLDTNVSNAPAGDQTQPSPCPVGQCIITDSVVENPCGDCPPDD